MGPLSLGARGPALAKMRGSEILQVVSNLIINSVDALPRGVGRMWIGVKASKETVHVAVADDGPGIAEDIAPQLFGPYVTNKTSGTGLGLWLSKRIAEKQGGSPRFRTSRMESAKGRSFVFRFQLACRRHRPSQSGADNRETAFQETASEPLKRSPESMVSGGHAGGRNGRSSRTNTAGSPVRRLRTSRLRQ